MYYNSQGSAGVEKKSFLGETHHFVFRGLQGEHLGHRVLDAPFVVHHAPRLVTSVP